MRRSLYRRWNQPLSVDARAKAWLHQTHLACWYVLVALLLLFQMALNLQWNVCACQPCMQGLKVATHLPGAIEGIPQKSDSWAVTVGRMGHCHWH